MLKAVEISPEAIHSSSPDTAHPNRICSTNEYPLELINLLMWGVPPPRTAQHRSDEGWVQLPARDRAVSDVRLGKLDPLPPPAPRRSSTVPTSDAILPVLPLPVLPSTEPREGGWEMPGGRRPQQPPSHP